MNITTGMTVRVIRGNYKGQEGKILYVFPKKERVIIEGVNLIKRHMRPSQDNPQGGIVEKEGSIHVSNVMLIHNGKPTRIDMRWKRWENDGKSTKRIESHAVLGTI